MMKKLTRFALFVACVSLLFSVVQADNLSQPLTAKRAIDLSHKMHEGMPFWPGGVPFKMQRLVDYDQGYQLHKFEVGENTGTHVDAPSHFIKGKRAIDEIPLAELIIPAVVIDVQDKVAGNPDYELNPEDIKLWESKHGTIPENSLVILNTGWHKRFGSPEQYINMDGSNVMHFPGYHPDSAKVLIERGIAGVGIDTLSLDHGPSKNFAFHVEILKANKYQIENMANLVALPTKGATVIVGVLPVKAGSQAQARVIALLP